jgi:hypothetical protein
MTSKYYTPPKCGLAARPLLLICNNIKISEITQAQVKKMKPENKKSAGS